MADAAAIEALAERPVRNRRVQREDKLASLILLAGIAVTALLVVGIIQALARG